MENTAPKDWGGIFMLRRFLKLYLSSAALLTQVIAFRLRGYPI